MGAIRGYSALLRRLFRGAQDGQVARLGGLRRRPLAGRQALKPWPGSGLEAQTARAVGHRMGSAAQYAKALLIMVLKAGDELAATAWLVNLSWLHCHYVPL